MIHLADPEAPPARALLSSEGAFLWWYLDLVDPKGDGLVCIWSFGLPFLPGQRAAARAGQATTPAQRPSLALSTFRAGRPDLYLLTELEPGEARWAAGERVVLGRSVLESRAEGERRVVELSLDCDVPGFAEPLVGTIRAEGPRLRAVAPEDPASHRWAPLTTACAGRADLRLGERALSLEGRAYHDRNDSSVPLDRLGIDHWLWGRVPLPGEERIWYALWPEGGGEPEVLQLAVRDGAIRRLPDATVTVHEPRRARYGLRYPARIALGDLTLRVAHVVDDGPFYLRFLTDCDGVLGTAEAVVPSRVDLGWQRPLVRMAVHRAAGGNSRFLPLFCGPRQGRLRRFLASLGAP